MRILTTAGGTGGHIYPLLAVISELQKEAQKNKISLRIRYLGSAGQKYRSLLESKGVKTQKIMGSKMRRYFSISNLVDMPKFILSIFQALWKVFWFMPDVVFSKGGSGSIPVVLAARFYRIPVVIHETDSIPSLTGRITGNFANVIAVSFESAGEYFSGKKGRLVITGNPVRASLLERHVDEKSAKSYFRFSSDFPCILVLGGSQGAVSINDFVLGNLRNILGIAQVLHQVGEKNYGDFLGEYAVVKKELSKELMGRYKPVEYFNEDLDVALSAADIVVSRAGGAIFEIAAFRKPSILVPLAGSADGHQMKNAIEYSKTGAAIMFEQENLLPNLFISTVKDLFTSPNKLIEMSKAADTFYRPDAALKLARIILTIKGK